MEVNKKMDNLEKILNDFASELIDHCAVVKDGKTTLSEEKLNSFIKSYIKTEKVTKNKRKSLFKFPSLLSEENLKNDSIVFVISEEEIQGEAESAGIERRLTDDELHKIARCFYEDDSLAWQRMVMMREAIDKVLDY